MYTLPTGSRDGVVRDVSEPLAAHSSLVHVVMDTHCSVQNDSVRDLFVTFKRWFLTRARNVVKTDVHLFLIPVS